MSQKNAESWFQTIYLNILEIRGSTLTGLQLLFRSKKCQLGFWIQKIFCYICCEKFLVIFRGRSASCIVFEVLRILTSFVTFAIVRELKSALSGRRQFLINSFYFSLKALFILKIFKFLFLSFAHEENGLIRKVKLISKFMMSQHG